MPHIHTTPGHHDHTVSIYIFRTDLSTPHVLFHYHHKINAYAQFGGHIELHETPWQAVLHELKEESGYDIDALKLLQPMSRLEKIEGAVLHPHPVVHATMTYGNALGHFHTDTTYAFTALVPPADVPAEDESRDLKLFSREEVASSSKIDTITRDTALYIFDTILSSWEEIQPNLYK